MVLLVSAVQSTHDSPYPLDPVVLLPGNEKKKQLDIGSIIYFPMIFLGRIDDFGIPNGVAFQT